jgi:hypothetical protein
LPVIVNELGQKLSKQTGAVPLDPDRTAYELERASEFLREAAASIAARKPVHS